MSKKAEENNTPADALTFEQSFSRLEELLRQLNSENLPLEQALTFYEEAETLIKRCNERLNDADRRIEKILKDREGTVIEDNLGRPATEPFHAPQGR